MDASLADGEQPEAISVKDHLLTIGVRSTRFQ
jgi:hypothetical protein